MEDQSPTFPKQDYTMWLPHMTGMEGMEGFLSVGERVWQDYTAYSEADDEWSDAEPVVPVEVLARMREIEGASEAEWNRRGVEISAVGWGPMREWLSSKAA